jgi:hypothetical protein
MQTFLNASSVHGYLAKSASCTDFRHSHCGMVLARVESPAGDVDVNELRELTFIGHIVTFTSGRYKRAWVDDENIRLPGLFALPSEMTSLVLHLCHSSYFDIWEK